MADAHRRHGFDGLGATDPGGALAAWAAPLAGQAAIRATPEDAAELASVLGFPLAMETDRAGQHGPVTTFRLGPDYWLALHKTDAGFGRRLEGLDGVHALDQTSARARLRLRGAAVRDLLAVGAAHDLRPRSFPPGAFAQTAVGNATAILFAAERDVFDVLIARSFAVSWARWLEHAGQEFMLELAGGSRR